MALSLSRIVEVFKVTHENSLVQICGTDYRFQFVGTQFAELLKLDVDKFIGKNLFEVDCIIQPLASTYKELNAPAINGVATVSYYTYGVISDQFKIIYNKVHPIRVDGLIIGIIIETTDLMDVGSFSPKLFSTFQYGHLQVVPVYQYDLTTILDEEEELIAFLVSLGKSDKQIAAILVFFNVLLSPSGVTKFIRRRIYVKLGVLNREQLMGKLFYLRLTAKLPQLLLKNPQLLKNTIFN